MKNKLNLLTAIPFLAMIGFLAFYICTTEFITKMTFVAILVLALLFVFLIATIAVIKDSFRQYDRPLKGVTFITVGIVVTIFAFLPLFGNVDQGWTLMLITLPIFGVALILFTVGSIKILSSIASKEQKTL